MVVGHSNRPIAVTVMQVTQKTGGVARVLDRVHHFGSVRKRIAVPSPVQLHASQVDVPDALGKDRVQPRQRVGFGLVIRAYSALIEGPGPCFHAIFSSFACLYAGDCHQQAGWQACCLSGIGGQHLAISRWRSGRYGSGKQTGHDGGQDKVVGARNRHGLQTAGSVPIRYHHPLGWVPIPMLDAPCARAIVGAHIAWNSGGKILIQIYGNLNMTGLLFVRSNGE